MLTYMMLLRSTKYVLCEYPGYKDIYINLYVYESVQCINTVRWWHRDGRQRQRQHAEHQAGCARLNVKWMNEWNKKY